jgi:predicted alpha-1,6-mannanase (GH76 family)
VDHLRNIIAVAAGLTNGAVDRDGDLFTWRPHQYDITCVQHGALVSVCAGSLDSGLCLDKNSKMYEWHHGSLTDTSKRVSRVFQGHSATFVVSESARTYDN